MAKMDTSARFGKRCIVRIRHYGCWASELSLWLYEVAKRPDLELVVFARSVTDDPLSYRAVAVIKSREQKEIDEALNSSIVQFLLQHRIIRTVQPRLPRPSKFTTILLIEAFDEESPAAIRAVLRHDGRIDEQVGMLVYSGVENVTFFTDSETASIVTGEIQEEYGRQSRTYNVLGVELGQEYTSYDEIIRDPYYLPTYILCSEEKWRMFIEVAKKGIKELGEWLVENAPWVIPLLVKVLEWLFEARSPPMTPTQTLRFLI